MSYRKLKILHTVNTYLPSRNGMSEVVKQISEFLVKNGHEVVVATRKNTERKEFQVGGVLIKEFLIDGNILDGIKGTNEEIKRYQDFLLESQFDVITNFAAEQWASDLAFSILHKIKAKKVFVPTGFARLYDENVNGYFDDMPKWLHNYDHIVFLSDNYRDINFARKHSISNFSIIPNGASKEEFLKPIDPLFKKKLGINENNEIILHIGTFGLKGQIEAIKIFLLSALKNVTLLLVSESADKINLAINNLKSLRILKFLSSNKNIIVKKLSREEVVQAYLNSSIFLFPSNLECSPIVLFECAASKTPFLSTDVGNAREISKWTMGGLILPTKQLANGLVSAKILKSSFFLNKVWKNKSLLKELGENGFKNWSLNFTWEEISKKYEKLYLNILKND